jgi:hypothetical protein
VGVGTTQFIWMLGSLEPQEADRKYKSFVCAFFMDVFTKNKLRQKPVKIKNK